LARSAILNLAGTRGPVWGGQLACTITDKVEVDAVAKGKRTPALFEIINRAQIQGQNPHLQVPGWWRSLSETAEADKNLSPPSGPETGSANGEAETAAYDRVADAVEEAAMTAQDDAGLQHTPISDAVLIYQEPIEPPPADEPDAPSSEDEGGLKASLAAALKDTFRLETGRIQFSVSLVAAAVAGGVFLLILSVSFAWGHALGKVAGVAQGVEQARRALEEQAVDSVELARKLQPNASVLNLSEHTGTGGVAPSSAAKAPRAAAPRHAGLNHLPAPAGTLRQVGWNYLVVQHFRGEDSRQEAAKAERFILAQMPNVQGQPSVTIEQRPDGGHILLSTLGYPPNDAVRRDALEQFREQIRRIGKEYRQRGGGYDFKDAYPMRLSHMPKRRK
jgi:hypothetical protein